MSSKLCRRAFVALLTAGVVAGCAYVYVFGRALDEYGEPQPIDEQTTRSILEERGVTVPDAFRQEKMTIVPVFTGAPSLQGRFSAPASNFDDYRDMMSARRFEIATCGVSGTPACDPNIVSICFPSCIGPIDITKVHAARAGDRAVIDVDSVGH